jgi:glycosyltransferase involved in cell wall biosynthesis
VEKIYHVDLSDKASIAAHGNYDGCYPSVEGMELKLRERFEIDQDAVVILFFGAIRPYKGVERLIDAFHVVKDRNLRLLIAGSTADNSFAQSILKASKDDPRVIPAIGFVPENEVSALFSISDVVALPFEKTLTSGSATLACTMGKALLVPESAKVFDFVNNRNALFFDSKEQLTAMLGKLDKIDLEKRGLHAREVVNGFVWEQEATKIAATYGK